jgi:hypothetical protein
MSEITCFRGILPPEGTFVSGRPYAPPPRRISPGSLILSALHPLRGELDAALARDDRPAAQQIAFAALAQVADALAAYRGDKLRPGQVRVHALLVELEPLPYAVGPDGSLAEQGTEVRVSYRNWAVDRHAAAALAESLARRFQALWPGAWIVLPAVAHASR